MDSCIFCEITSGAVQSQKLYETEELIVIPDIHPQAPVHLLIIPKQHVEEFIDLSLPLMHKIFEMAKHVIEEQYVDSYRLISNGKNAAVIDHFHLHILGNVDKLRSL